MKTSTVNVPFEIQLDSDGHGFSFATGIDVLSIYATEGKAKKVLRQRIGEKVRELVQGERNYQKGMIGLQNGDILLVDFRHGSWGYQFFGPGRRSGGGGSCSCGKTFVECMEYARRHAEQCGGAIWENI